MMCFAVTFTRFNICCNCFTCTKICCNVTSVVSELANISPCAWLLWTKEWCVLLFLAPVRTWHNFSNSYNVRVNKKSPYRDEVPNMLQLSLLLLLLTLPFMLILSSLRLLCRIISVCMTSLPTPNYRVSWKRNAMTQINKWPYIANWNVILAEWLQRVCSTSMSDTRSSSEELIKVIRWQICCTQPSCMSRAASPLVTQPCCTMDTENKTCEGALWRSSLAMAYADACSTVPFRYLYL